MNASLVSAWTSTSQRRRRNKGVVGKRPRECQPYGGSIASVKARIT
jgi:hypothetical protein